ncbi:MULTISPECIES: DUF1905 domain-containing protein [unclassified Microbacterium]|jgi:hypothetical protein|uniref:DUF1905 domain-containing protein n=1 Tax=unclassified Microbacterium TaxID=2609290 RepID=UPI000C2C0577|nr:MULTISPECIES: DUF1905 domain-containing protein [unclassified Microbacterium]
MIVDFEGTVYRWDARTDASWFFTDLPPDDSEAIREMQDPALRRGFGAVRIRVTIGDSVWMTSMFPSSAGTYTVPLKKSVRDRQGLAEGDQVQVRVELTL